MTSGGSVSIGPGANVSGNVTINQGSDPAALKLVEDTVRGLVDQLKNKDEQIQIRDEQTQQLSSAVAALARQRDRPDAPLGLKKALDNLATGDTEAAKAIFRQVLDEKSSEAKAAGLVAADAAKHLGALATLNDEREAAQAYERAIELVPGDSAARNLLATLQKEPGKLRLKATLADDGTPVKACFEVYHPQQDLDGNRKEVARACNTTAHFSLSAGKYFVAATAGNARTSQEFEIASGQLVNRKMRLE